MSIHLPFNNLGYTCPENIPSGHLRKENFKLTDKFIPYPELSYVGDQIKEAEMMVEYTPITLSEVWRFLMAMRTSVHANGWFGIEASNDNTNMTWDNGIPNNTGTNKFTVSKNQKHTFLLNNDGLKVDSTFYSRKAEKVFQGDNGYPYIGFFNGYYHRFCFKYEGNIVFDCIGGFVAVDGTKVFYDKQNQKLIPAQ